jgi:hypothetical protein
MTFQQRALLSFVALGVLDVATLAAFLARMVWR